MKLATNNEGSQAHDYLKCSIVPRKGLEQNVFDTPLMIRQQAEIALLLNIWSARNYL